MGAAMRFLGIKKKIHEVGFDEFCQAGLPNIFHPMNIVCVSHVLNLQFWVCADGGYRPRETYHIASRALDDVRAPTECTSFKTQTALIAGLEDIRQRIAAAKAENDRQVIEEV